MVTLNLHRCTKQNIPHHHNQRDYSLVVGVDGGYGWGGEYTRQNGAIRVYSTHVDEGTTYGGTYDWTQNKERFNTINIDIIIYYFVISCNWNIYNKKYNFRNIIIYKIYSLYVFNFKIFNYNEKNYNYLKNL